MRERRDGRFVADDRFAVGGSPPGFPRRAMEVVDRFLPELTAEGVVSEPLEMLGEAVGIERLDCLRESGMEQSSAIVEQAPVGDVVSQRVLERDLDIREEGELVEELCGLQASEPVAKRFLAEPGDRAKEIEGHVFADYGGQLEELLF